MGNSSTTAIVRSGDAWRRSGHPLCRTPPGREPQSAATHGLYRWSPASELRRVFGIDLTKIPGIRIGIAQTLVGEIGPDFTKFRSASAFASWMGLCPDNEISGGKVLWVGTRKVKCRAAAALSMAAQFLRHSKSALGNFYRRMRAKLGAPKTITAAAHKLARIIFHLVPPVRNSTTAGLPPTNCDIKKGGKRRNYVPRRKHLDSNSSPAPDRVSSLEAKDRASRGHTKEELGISDAFCGTLRRAKGNGR